MSTITIETKRELGEWMTEAGVRQWLGYDDEGTFTVEYDDDGVTLTDPDEGVTKRIGFIEFYEEHVKGVHQRGYAGVVASQYIDWCSDHDDYDDYTCDFVVQMSLYGKIIYG